MIPFEKIKTVVFDYDGTLHNSALSYIKSFQKAYKYLVDKNLAEKREFREEEITCWLGYNSREMWQLFMPRLSEEERNHAAEIIRRETFQIIKNRETSLYEGVPETLNYLKERGYHVLYLSNCRPTYRDIHKEVFQLDRYFEKMYCAGEYQFASKYEIFKEIMKEFPGDYLMAGDRYHDLEVGKYEAVYTAGCSYGFGTPEELAEADILIQDIRELKNLL